MQEHPVKVITYGTYDLLHEGHIRLLKRAKALGDYLIVGVTADDFDRSRGKINVQQSLIERVEAVRATGLADEIVVEEYEGQKIEDIKRLNVDIFTVGSDWVGKFDYLNEFCKVIYLERTAGISSTELRSANQTLQLGIIGESKMVSKFINECSFVNGVKLVGFWSKYPDSIGNVPQTVSRFNDPNVLIDETDAVYIVTAPTERNKFCRYALNKGKHVLCESPIALTVNENKELYDIATHNDVILMEAIKTAYSQAYSRMILLAKSGKIGEVVSVDAVCTSMKSVTVPTELKYPSWNSLLDWGPTALLPVFQLLGSEPVASDIINFDNRTGENIFSKVTFIYPNAVASIKVGNGVKSEGILTITGTKGYIYVPAPWWKTDYFEMRYENPHDNKRYFYSLEGEGIRGEISAFVKSIQKFYSATIGKNLSQAISSVMENRNDSININI